MKPPVLGWGAATSSFQIEGGRSGRVESIWDRFCATPGKVFERHHADVACDHRHRWAQDLDLLSTLGAQSYRFSVSWARVLGEGWGFYDELVDGLLARGITPVVNLYHWDLPQIFEEEGGWLDDTIVERFAGYAHDAAQQLGDRVRVWLTFNEPNCFLGDGYGSGVHAPGKQVPTEVQRLAVARWARAHGAAVRAMRSVRPDFAISIALAGSVYVPNNESAIAAARERTWSVPEGNLWSFLPFIEPFQTGTWPDGWPASGEPAQPLDFITLNLYSGPRVDADGQALSRPWGAAANAMGWPVEPDILEWGPRFFYERYGLPVLIGENGVCTPDWVTAQGTVPDGHRIDFMHRHLVALERAQRAGVPLLGYHAWSLLDNFEWAEGYRRRFGLVHVDFETLERVPKASFEWYRDWIRTHPWGG